MNKKIYLFIAIIALASIAIASTAEWRPPPLVWGGEAQKVVDQLLTFICGPACIIIDVSVGLAALLLIFAGARYVAADDPGTRTEIRRFIIGIIVGLVIVVISMPVINFIIGGILPDVKCDCIGSIDNINSVFCNLISALSTIGPWLCALMVIYGGLRYLTSVDDPGARKAAKTTVIAAVVGMIIIMLAIPLVNMVLAGALDQVNCEISRGPIADQIITILGNFLCILGLIAPPICALVVTYGGLRYITSAEDPGARDTAKTIIISALIGMILVMLAVPLVNVMLTSSFGNVTFNCSQGQATTEITQIMCNFICFFSYIAPAVCALVVIYGGIRYLVSGDDPGARRIARTIIISAFVGLIIVLLSMPLVNLVLTSVFGQVSCNCSESDSVRQVIQILCKFICLFASIAPAISALVIILGGLRYVSSAEDPAARKAAKTMIISAIVGLILVMISLSLVNIFVSGIAKNVQCGCFNVEDPAKQISKIFCTLACTLQMITPAVAVIVILYGGLKYLTTGDDPGARASARGIVIHAIIGLVFVMLAIQIVNMVILNLMPTFKCDCGQVFGTIGSPSPADPKLHILSVPGTEDACDHNGEIGGKCCMVGDSECYYVAGGNIQHIAGKIIGCIPPSTAKSSYTFTVGGGDAENPLITMTTTVQADAKCADTSGNPFCSSITEAAGWGSTYIFDASKGVCINKCAQGVKCCLTTDKDGHPGCIGTDTQNVIKMFSCIGDVKTTYSCKNDKCDPTEAFCDPFCPNQYTCPSASPDPGDLSITNPEIN